MLMIQHKMMVIRKKEKTPTNVKVNVGQLPRYFLYYGMVTYTMLKKMMEKRQYFVATELKRLSLTIISCINVVLLQKIDRR